MTAADPSAATEPHAHSDALAISEPEAARLCGVSGKTLKRLADSGEDIGRAKVFNRTVYVVAKLRGWLTQQADAQRTAPMT